MNRPCMRGAEQRATREVASKEGATRGGGAERPVREVAGTERPTEGRGGIGPD